MNSFSVEPRLFACEHVFSLTEPNQSFVKKFLENLPQGTGLRSVIDNSSITFVDRNDFCRFERHGMFLHLLT